MSAEVITGEFRSQDDRAAAYSLPASAAIGLPILDRAHTALIARPLGCGALEVGDLDLCFRGLVDEVLRGDVELKGHFQSVGPRPFQRRGA